MKLEERYRAHILRKLRSRNTPVGRLINGDAEEANWLLALFPGMFICWAFSLTGRSSLPVLIPTFIIVIGGISYVLWVRIKYLTEWQKELAEQDESDLEGA